MSKVIVVPPYAPPPVPAQVNVVDRDVPYRQTNYYVNPPVMPTFDPMESYRMLYLRNDHRVPPPSEYFHLEAIRRNVWDTCDIIEWCEANARDTVLIQHRPMNHDLHMVFGGGHPDLMAFRTWLQAQTVTSFTINCSPDELTVWINDNIKGRFRVSSAGAGQRHVSIKEPNEALLFKLRWVGRPDEERA